MDSAILNAWNVVTVRWGSDEDEEGVFRVVGVQVTSEIVLAICAGHVEVHFVKPTNDPRELALIQCFGPIFRVGERESDLPVIFEDLQRLSIVEFVRKYPHSEMLEYLEECKIELPRLKGSESMLQ